MTVASRVTISTSPVRTIVAGRLPLTGLKDFRSGLLEAQKHGIRTTLKAVGPASMKLELRNKEMGMSKNWIQMDLDCPSESAEELAAELADRFQIAVEVRDRGLRWYVADDGRCPGLAGEMKRVAASHLGITAAELAGALRISQIADEDWTREWKKYFQPLRIGKHFMVVPSWETYRPLTDDRIIEINPGQAFGTGHHETTRLCLEWLEAYAADLQDGRCRGGFLDVGTGSGILSIAANLVSFRTVTAIDIDPIAVVVAKENAVRNGITGTIHWACCSVDAVTGSYEVVMANIQALPLIRMAAGLRQRIAAGGRLALSGILQEQANEVQSAFLNQGLVLRSHAQAGEWCLLEWSLDRGAGKSGRPSRT